MRVLNAVLWATGLACWLCSLGWGLALGIQELRAIRKRRRNANRRWEQAIAVQKRRWQEYPKWERQP